MSFILLSIKAIDSGVSFLTESTIPSQIITERSLALFFKARKSSFFYFEEKSRDLNFQELK